MRKKNKQIRPIDAPLYNYWQALYLSFFSKRLYIDVLKRWRGFNFLYLLFVVALATIPFSLRVIIGIDHYFNEQVIYPLSKLPTFYVQNGHVSFDQPMPYFIKNTKGEVIDIIDTTGKVKNITSAYPKLILLITKNKIFSRYPKLSLFFSPIDGINTTEVNVKTLNSSMNEVFNVQDWIESGRLRHLKWFVSGIIYPVMVSILFSMFLVIMVVFGYTANIFAQVVLKYKLKFKEGIRLFIVTSTPQMILFYIVYTTGYHIKGIGVIQLILMAVYFNCAVLCIKHESKQLVRS